MSMRLVILWIATAALGACETIKPYEKEYLLNPVMDDAVVGSLQAPLMSQAITGFEKLAGGAGATGGSSCPTCGG